MSTCYKRMGEPVVAFRTAADAWFWTMGALQARREGSERPGAPVKRPCDPDDVLCCLDRLYRNRRIDLGHARVLRDWGQRQMSPDTRTGSGVEALLWREALSRLEAPLRLKGIIA